MIHKSGARENETLHPSKSTKNFDLA